MTTQPVLIAGSGPAGSLLALYLSQQEIPVILFEKQPDLPVDLRASTFHPPSLEMLDELGVADAMIAKGLKVDRYQYRDRRTKEVAEFDMGLLSDDTRFPFRLQLEQYEMTRIINQQLANYPTAQVLFSHEVLGFSQDDNGVTVLVNTPDNEKQFRGSFLLGCDGASSQVRKAAGIGYGGFTYNEKFLVVSTPFPFEQVFDNLSYVNYISDPDEWCVLLRTEKLWRVLWPTDPAEANPAQTYLNDQYIQQRLQHLHAKAGDYDIGHKTLYAVHQRVAERYVQGRMVLVGDAAHINNPLGGMGMNGGLHDAHNLAQKLTCILKEGASYPELFAQYERQRKDLAVEFVQQHTIANKQMMETKDPEQQQKRQQWFMETAADPSKARAFMLERAMFNCLRDSLQQA
ncbi:NAD(P)/FAD-dependent oxidoreductase [Alkalimonas sp.]|uniref:FAD-dependent oxidoreductase n=1 Tax=Alkalimonas sp. TaxID=1872453 RepID=UPI00263BD874|nr:NAD(P)/FAD-dependent oxidoreductase [Alkalimonas sp.]MCC5825037.1 FAD-dependent monooxygenase [Alkalimonas sp.]